MIGPHGIYYVDVNACRTDRWKLVYKQKAYDGESAVHRLMIKGEIWGGQNILGKIPLRTQDSDTEKEGSGEIFCCKASLAKFVNHTFS